MKKADLNRFQSKNIRAIVTMLKALADPTRLKIMSELEGKVLTVNEIVKLVGTGQANISKHLQILSQSYLLKSKKKGTFVLYAYYDVNINKICKAVCSTYEKIIREKLKGH